jgi:hypothetical protein
MAWRQIIDASAKFPLASGNEVDPPALDLEMAELRGLAAPYDRTSEVPHPNMELLEANRSIYSAWVREQFDRLW